MSNRVSKLRKEALACVKVADRTADNKLAAALLAYACELEQRARVMATPRRAHRRNAALAEAKSRARP